MPRLAEGADTSWTPVVPTFTGLRDIGRRHRALILRYLSFGLQPGLICINCQPTDACRQRVDAIAGQLQGLGTQRLA